MVQKVAAITGGASGLGYAVAQALLARGGWDVHLIDLKDGPATPPAHTFYHKVDITNYAQLGATFKEIFFASGAKRLDFVWANAGIFEKFNWFAVDSEHLDEPPAEPDWLAMEINLKACMNTVRIGRHYMAQNPDGAGGAIVATSSSAGIWPTYCSPIYTTSKHGVVGYVRSVADWYWRSDKIRTNALCPGAVKTDILPQKVWDSFDAKIFTPLELVVGVVLKFVDGEPITDANGVTPEKNYGQAVVPAAANIYHQFMPPLLDDAHRSMVENTHVHLQTGTII